jgi:hypothetical protein
MNKNIVGLAHYKKEDWKRFLASVHDRKKVESTWEDWEKNQDKLTKYLTDKNILFEKIIIDLEEMDRYLTENKLNNVAKNRSLYASEVLREKNSR